MLACKQNIVTCAGSEEEELFVASNVASGWNHTMWTSTDLNKVLQVELHAAALREGLLPSTQDEVNFGEAVTICALAAGEQHRQASHLSASAIREFMFHRPERMTSLLLLTALT